jgi:hypothetical protein
VSNLKEDLALISPEPWNRGGWTGEFISTDGTTTSDITEADVQEVLHYAKTSPGWDGETVGIVCLLDGRIVAWEADWGPTGDGFYRDAYGGTADILFSQTVQAALAYISDQGKDLLRNSSVIGLSPC